MTELTIGTLTLTPTFSAEVKEYSATTTNASNKITATSDIEGATVTILVGETEIESGESATWETGENTVTITVEADGYTTATYTVTVTKGE